MRTIYTLLLFIPNNRVLQYSNGFHHWGITGTALLIAAALLILLVNTALKIKVYGKMSSSILNIREDP